MPSPSLSAIAGFEQKLVVGVGGMAVSNNRNTLMITYSLGSCVGVTIYDPVVGAGGMLHAMLPDSTINSTKAMEQPAMFVDTGVAALFRAAYELRVDKHRVRICVAGGAQFMDPSGFFNIGQRNCAALTQLFGRHGLSVEHHEIGGLVSRTMQLNLANGEVRLKSPGCNGDLILSPGLS